MKTKLASLICAAAVGFGFVSTATAVDRDPVEVAADALVVRPLCLVATVVGSAVFVVALPVAATSHSIDSTAHALVELPAWATFERPLGDFGYTSEYEVKYQAKRDQHRFARAQKAKERTARANLKKKQQREQVHKGTFSDLPD